MKRLSVIVLFIAGCGSGVLDPEASRTNDARSACRNWFTFDGVFADDVFNPVVVSTEAERNDTDITETQQIDDAAAICAIVCDNSFPFDFDGALSCAVTCQVCNTAIIDLVYGVD